VSSHAPNVDDCSLTRAISPSQQSRYEAHRITSAPAIIRLGRASSVSQQPYATRIATTIDTCVAVTGVRTSNREIRDDTGRNK
jgi:hypothetical protein